MSEVTHTFTEGGVKNATLEGQLRGGGYDDCSWRRGVISPHLTVISLADPQFFKVIINGFLDVEDPPWQGRNARERSLLRGKTGYVLYGIPSSGPNFRKSKSP